MAPVKQEPNVKQEHTKPRTKKEQSSRAGQVDEAFLVANLT